MQLQSDSIDAAADQAKLEFNLAVDARSTELKQQLHRGFNHHSRDIAVALQNQASLLAAAEAAAVSLDAAAAGSAAAHALFDLCTRASSPSPAHTAAEFQRSLAPPASVPLLGQLNASRRAVWSSGGGSGVKGAPSSGGGVALTSGELLKTEPRAVLSRSSVSSGTIYVPKSISPAAAASADAVAAARCPSFHSAAGSGIASSASASAPVYEFICSIGVKGSEDGQFETPWGVAVDEEGRILVSEKNGNRLQVLQRSEESGQWIFSKKTGFKGPRGVASVKGMVVVAHTESHELLLKPEMSLISAKKDWIVLASGLLNNPNGVDIDSDVNIWVADTGNR